MFKYTLAATLDEMDREDITVAECPLRSMRCLSLQNGRIVGINTARFDSSAEVRTALIHEDGHFASGAFYLPYSPYQLKAQAEYRADKAAVLKHIPYPELAARLRRGDTLADCNLVRRTEKGRLRRRGWGLRWEKAQKGGKGTNLRGFFED